MSFIAAPHIISPLGNSVHENFERALVGQSALRLHSDHPFAPVDIPFGIITDHERSEGWTKLESLCLQSCQQSLAQLKDTSGKWLLIFCTTKGDIDRLASGLSEEVKPQYLAQKVAKELPIEIDTEVVSNACISGLLGVIMAHDYVSTGVYDHVLVLGGDLFSDFTYQGFESFMALSAQACKPFDANRDGLSLGEAVVSVVVSDQKEIYSQVDCQVLGGASANDANHISGPSRTGEGLYRSIQKTWKQTGLSAEEVDAVSAHGTATRYNDDMESIAFHRAGLAAKPINSMKGYFGHTLGAAGLLELVMSMESMRAGIFLSSLGCEAPGTTEEINVVTENTPMEIHTLLKTTSGFGGCNAAAIIQKIQ